MSREMECPNCGAFLHEFDPSNQKHEVKNYTREFTVISQHEWKCSACSWLWSGDTVTYFNQDAISGG